MYGQAPPGTAAYNPQGGVTILNRNPVSSWNCYLQFYNGMLHVNLGTPCFKLVIVKVL
jgi:hypothetical protein